MAKDLEMREESSTVGNIDFVFRDPYPLDILGLKDNYSESDLGAAVLRELQRFLPELGADFPSIVRHKRTSIGGSEFYPDLQFYNRDCAAWLLLGSSWEFFKAEYKALMIK